MLKRPLSGPEILVLVNYLNNVIIESPTICVSWEMCRIEEKEIPFKADHQSDVPLAIVYQ